VFAGLRSKTESASSKVDSGKVGQKNGSAREKEDELHKELQRNQGSHHMLASNTQESRGDNR